LWFTNFGSVDTTRIGLCWFDGSQFGVFPVEDGGLPHAQISDMEIKTISGGYELWMSCLSRGIAVMTVTTSAVGLETTKNCQLPPVLKNFPNPFADGTIISFISPAEGVSRFTITDIHGRIIRDFGTLKLMAGQYHLEWDGNNSHGQKVGAGIFVGRLEQEGQITSILLISLE
jgi:hypothetical protein